MIQTAEARRRNHRRSGVRRDTAQSTAQMFFQEHVDLRMETPEWMMPGFDDSGWEEPGTASAWDSMPWPALETRGVPLLREERKLVPFAIGVAQGGTPRF